MALTGAARYKAKIANRTGESRRILNSQVYIVEFIFLLFIFLVLCSTQYFYAFFGNSPGLECTFFAAYAATFILYSYLFAIGFRKGKMLNALFAFGILLFAISAYASTAAIQFAVTMTNMLMLLSLSLLFLVPTMFIVSIGTYFYTESKKFAFALFCIALVLSSLYFLTGIVYKGIMADDETLISEYATQELLHGVNPYGISFSKQLFYSSSKGTLTISTSSTILGNLQYPPMFLLSFAAIYLIGSAIHATKSTIYLLMLDIYLFAMLLIIFSVRERRYRLKPSLPFFTILALSVMITSAFQDLLIIALLIAAYEKLDSKYAWVFIGLAAAMQELVWIPILLLLAYLALEKGLGRALMQAGLALLLFLAISFWFIVTKPAAFGAALFAPLSNPLPSGVSAFGYALLRDYGITLSAYPLLFASAILICLLLLYLSRSKQLIPLLSMLPFLVLDHSLITYYIMLGTWFAFALFLGKEQKAKTSARSFWRYAALSGIALILVSDAALVGISHESLVRNFNITLSNTTMSALPESNTTMLYASLRYNGLANGTEHIYFMVEPQKGPAFEEGLLNETLINSNAGACENYTCKVSPNKLVLNGSGEYLLRARLNANARCATAIIYNDKYYRVFGPFCIK
ncbi:MAG: hypothetical protein ACP5MC_00570 [Candidatus Micrarchaeia archaeon]